MPSAVEGEVGSRLRTPFLSLKNVADTGLPRTRFLMEHFGLVISPAERRPLHAAGRLRPEREAIFQADQAATTKS